MQSWIDGYSEDRFQKSSLKAIQARKEGNTYFFQKKYKQALEYYDQVLLRMLA